MTKAGANTDAGSFRRPDKRRGHSVGKTLLIIVGMVVVMVGVWGPTTRSAHASTSGAYNVVGSTVVDANGTKFVPYGFVVSCLSAPVVWCTNAAPHQTSAIAQQVQAAGTTWHANTVRFQVAQEHLFDQAPYDATYLSQLDSVVNQANSLGMVAVISLQEEKYNGPVMPTQSAVAFWNLIATHYASNPRVFFDLYNEPRLTEVQAGGDIQLVWNIWRNGGTVGGVTYVGMQALVNGIRATGANNIVIAEGTLWATSLLGIPQWQLTGSNIAYGIKPNLAGINVGPQSWYADFGAVASQVPVIPQEFDANISSATCQPNSPTVLPALLSYLTTLKLGLIDYSMDPGNAVLIGSNYKLPTSYPSSTIPCLPNTPANPANPIGNGAALQSWFTANSTPAVP